MNFTLYGKTFTSRMLLGSAHYTSPQLIIDSVKESKAEIVTLSLRRQNPAEKEGAAFWNTIRATGCALLPNTAGCKTVKEAVNLAEMSREIFSTDWIKLEIIGDDYNLQPDPVGLLEATRELIQRGFKVFPYTTDDLVICQKLRDLGCEVIMPWASPIGTGQGLLNKYNLGTLRKRLPTSTLIVDAGIGAPSQAAEAMEMGYDSILLNSAVAKAQQPPLMAKAFAGAIAAGRDAYIAGLMEKRQTAAPSTPTIGQPFWQQKK